MIKNQISMTKTLTLDDIQKAKEYLKDNGKLQCIIDKRKRTLFYNSQTDVFGILAHGKRKSGYVFTDWHKVTRFIYPAPKRERERRIVRKMKKLASLASFSNNYIRKVLAADDNKGVFEQNLTTGTRIDGDVVTFKSIANHSYGFIERFQQAMKEKKEFWDTFDYNGYDGSVHLAWIDGEPYGYFNKEYRGCANGYYYLLINDHTFIGYDID